MSDRTKVIFRRYKGTGEVIALFPEMPATYNLDTCISYMHVGQHGEAALFPDNTEPANTIDFWDLKKELEGLGYVLTIRERNDQRYRDVRRTQIEQWRAMEASYTHSS